jgi:hypothetical protein
MEKHVILRMEVQMGLFGHKKKDEEEDILQFDELKDAADPDEEEQDSFQLEEPGDAPDSADADARMMKKSRTKIRMR